MIALPNKPVQLPLLFFLPFEAGRLERRDRQWLLKVIDRLMLVDSFEVKGKLNEIIRVERCELYRYGDHFRMFHNGRCFIIQLEGQRPKGNWYLLRYLLNAGIQLDTLKVTKDDARCVFDQPRKKNEALMQPPIVLLKRQPKESNR